MLERGEEVYHELGVLGPRVRIEGDEEVLFSHGLLGGAWRGSRDRRRGRVHRRQVFVSSGIKRLLMRCCYGGCIMGGVGQSGEVDNGADGGVGGCKQVR